MMFKIMESNTMATILDYIRKRSYVLSYIELIDNKFTSLHKYKQDWMYHNSTNYGMARWFSINMENKRIFIYYIRRHNDG